MPNDNTPVVQLTGREPGTLHPCLLFHFKSQPWAEYPRVPWKKWQETVSNGNTYLGYWEWASEQLYTSDAVIAARKLTAHLKDL